MALLLSINFIFFLYSFFTIGKRDLFSFINLLNINYFFYAFVRPIYLYYFNDMTSPYAYYASKDKVLFLFTYTMLMLSYIFINIGYLSAFKSKAFKIKLFSINAIKQKIKIKRLFILSLLIGFLLEVYLINHAGGFKIVLLSLALRNEIFLVNNSFLIVSFAQFFILIGSYGLIVYYLHEKKVLYASLVLLFTLIIAIFFGGRGFLLNFIIGYLISYNYIYQKISLKKILIIGLILVSFLGTLGTIRDHLHGHDMTVQDVFKDKKTKNYHEKIQSLSRINRGFDYDLETMYYYLDNKIDYFGEYILGVSSLIPRNILPQKVDMLGARVAEDILGIKKYAITTSTMMAITIQWGFIAIPIISFLIGYTGGYLYRITILNSNSIISVVFYLLSYKFVSSLYTDLASFMQKYFILFVLFIFLIVLSKINFKRKLVI